jgi:hypothetical protein
MVIFHSFLYVYQRVTIVNSTPPAQPSLRLIATVLLHLQGSARGFVAHARAREGIQAAHLGGKNPAKSGGKNGKNQGKAGKIMGNHGKI